MVNWKELEKQFAARLAWAGALSPSRFLTRSLGRSEIFRHRTCRLQLLAIGGRGPHVLHRSRGSLQLRRGSYTHNIQLPPDRVQETETTLGMMFNLGYVRPEEVPGIPRLPKEPAAVVFAPLGDTPVAPSVVLFACKTSAAMLLNEASIRAGASGALPLLGRPSCMALPAALAHGTVSTLGCIGNRVYTESRRG